MTEEANPKPETKDSEELKPTEGDKPEPVADSKAEEGAKPASDATAEKPAEAKAGDAPKVEDAPKAADPPPPSDAAKPEEPKPDLTLPLKAEIADLKDRVLRLAADMENQRRRQDREMADAKQYAVTAFARELLAVGDSLSRALAAIPAEKRTGGDAVDNVLTGVEMTDRELQRVFEKHGVRKFGQAGEKFDPNRHQAIYEVPDGSVSPGAISQVVQSGYSIGERTLRPALVAVATAPKAAPAESAQSAESEKKS